MKAYVDAEVAGIVDSAPGALDTLNELAAALGDDANFSTTVTNSIAAKLPLAGGTMTGNLVVNTAGNSLPSISLSHSNANADNFLLTGGIPGTSNAGFSIRDVDASANRLVIDSSGNVGIGTTSPAAKLQVEEYGIDTTETSTTATTQVAIHTFAAATFRSARFTVQITNSTDSTYHLTEILMIHDGTTPSITEYGTIFTGSAEATFDADISSGNVRLLATPATTDSMAFKVVAHTITT